MGLTAIRRGPGRLIKKNARIGGRFPYRCCFYATALEVAFFAGAAAAELRFGTDAFEAVFFAGDVFIATLFPCDGFGAETFDAGVLGGALAAVAGSAVGSVVD